MIFFFIDRLNEIEKKRNNYLINLIQIILFYIPYIIINIPLIIKSNVAHSAHFGGALIGFLLSINIIGCPFIFNNQNIICQNACQLTTFIFISFYFIITFILFFSKYPPIVQSILQDS